MQTTHAISLRKRAARGFSGGSVLVELLMAKEVFGKALVQKKTRPVYWPGLEPLIIQKNLDLVSVSGLFAAALDEDITANPAEKK